MKLYKHLIFRKKISHLLIINFILFSFATTHLGLAQNADINLLKSINVDRNKSLDPTFKVITHSITPISIGEPIVVFSVGLIQKDSTLKNKGIFLAETFLVNGFITTALKFSINRDRPFVTYPFIDKQTDAGSHSFPSGHTSASFATATSLSLAFPKWYVIAPSFAWASAVGYSRMHLGVHYPSDVLAGAVVGAGSAFLSYKLNRWITGKYSKKKTNKKML
jgi:membrane-associated phospholipid phosphatase